MMITVISITVILIFLIVFIIKKKNQKKYENIKFYVSGYLADVRMNRFKCESPKEAKGMLEAMKEVKPEYNWVIEEERKM